MIRHLELEIYERAKELFERENPGKLWRLPVGIDSIVGQKLSALTERQNYLTRIRDQVRAESEAMATIQNSSIET